MSASFWLWTAMMFFAVPFSIFTAILGVAVIGKWVEAFQEFGPIAILGVFYFGPLLILFFGFLPWLITMSAIAKPWR